MDAYKIVRAIGQGNYGTVHLAKHRKEKQTYAIKMIPTAKQADGETALREAQTLAKLKHQNIIGYKESFLHENQLCIVTSYCEEGDLYTKIKEAAAAGTFFPLEVIMDWFVQIALGLAHVHGAKILHRDLKTQNILLAAGGIIKIADFGISKVLEGTNDFASTVTGTPYYMSPECCQNQRYSNKSDIWSLGCVLYECLTLKHAFDADNLLSLIFQIVAGTNPPVPERYGPRMTALVDAMLSRDPAERPSASQLLQFDIVSEHLKRLQLAQTSALQELKFKSNLRRLNGSKENAADAKREQRDVVVETGANRGPLHNVRTQVPSGSDGGGESSSSSLDNMSPSERLRRRKQERAAQQEALLRNAARSSLQSRSEAKLRYLREFHATSLSPAAPTSNGTNGHSYHEFDQAYETPPTYHNNYDNWQSHEREGRDSFDGPDSIYLVGSLAPRDSPPASTSSWDETPVRSGSPKPGHRGNSAGPQQQRLDRSRSSEEHSRDSPLGSRRPGSSPGFSHSPSLPSYDERPIRTAQSSHLDSIRRSHSATTRRHTAHEATNLRYVNYDEQDSDEEFPVHHSQQSTPASPSTATRQGSPLSPRSAKLAAAKVRVAKQQQAKKKPSAQRQKYVDDAYEDDFEAYEPDDDSSRAVRQEKQQQEDRTQLVHELRRLQDAPAPEVEERIEEELVVDPLPPSRVQTSEGWRQQCLQALGPACFERVYTYLRRVRTSKRPAAPAEVKAELMSIAGPANYRHCFIVDQLVYTELVA